MRAQGINLTEIFGYDEALLNAAQQDDWFAQHSEPPEHEHDGRARTTKS